MRESGVESMETWSDTQGNGSPVAILEGHLAGVAPGPLSPDQPEKEMENANIVSRGFTQVQFVDQYGEERTIYRQKGNALRIKKKQDTISHVLNRAAADLMGQKIKAARIARGYTLDALLNKAGLAAGVGQGKQRMYEIENAGRNHRGGNKQGVRFGTLYALAIALECDVAALLPSAEEVARHAGVALVAPAEPRVSKAA